MARVSIEEQQRRVAQKALECEIERLNNPPLSDNGSYCPWVWDRLMCWPETRAGTVSVQPCPDYIDKFRLDQNASRTCQEDGTWYFNPATNDTWTNFTSCIDNQPTSTFSQLIRSHMGRIKLMYTINYGISLGSLLLAVFIMLCFKRLHCPRNTIHLNLFGSFILRASISFMKENLLVEGLGFPSDVIETPDGGVAFKENVSHWECKLFFTTFHYVLGANYMWILVEALYLNMLITVAVFSERSGIKYYITFGWVFPLTFVIPWAIVRTTCENVLCWNTHPTEGFFWIMKGPIVLSIVINFSIFLNIIRVLFIKLNAVNSPEAKKFRKLAKSTLVLIPLFGVHYIVFLFLPNNVDERTELVKLYFEMFFNSIQGFFVALLFCFLNGEVQSEVRKTWARFRLTHQRTFSQESCRSRTAGGSTYTSYMSRARESVGSFQHAQDLRGKPDGRPCSYTAVMDETPMASLCEAAPRHPSSSTPNGKLAHTAAEEAGGGGLEVQPMLNHVSSEGEFHEDSGRVN
ncbi:secretin receptor-like isoform X2 [Babylonia areolata]|uniref:secretin receptor-like isoform X2 n=1 Tax=Babylonia areolata TaxID=304850 RepID=UPI003FD3FFDC